MFQALTSWFHSIVIQHENNATLKCRTVIFQNDIFYCMSQWQIWYEVPGIQDPIPALNHSRLLSPTAALIGLHICLQSFVANELKQTIIWACSFKVIGRLPKERMKDRGGVLFSAKVSIKGSHRHLFDYNKANWLLKCCSCKCLSLETVSSRDSNQNWERSWAVEIQT